MQHRKLIIALFVLTLFSCDKFEYSHYQILHKEDYRNINQNNISQFINTNTDTVTIAVLGDSQRFYDATIKPLSFGLAFSYTFGERFSKYQDHNKYPKGYYWWNTSIRFGLLYQAEVYYKINDKRIKGLSFYLEASFWDLDIYSFTGNSNYSHLSLWNITTLGIGTKIFF